MGRDNYIEVLGGKDYDPFGIADNYQIILVY
jgi:hypothetical protein